MRGHSLKLYKSRFNLDTGKFAFSNGEQQLELFSADMYLPHHLNIFKNKLDT